ncbi:metallophosphoesterase [Microcoleus sp. herbarium12]|uniref:metallophosphoesterase n=1 Tax=Microcoleus sp. herbarium12 TaxID=3055437 RepID=UPI002FD74544
MKIQILSDIHIEFQPFDITETDSDVIILAGDIHVGDKGVIWVLNNIQHKPVIYVLGNHEYYGNAYPKLITKLKDICKDTNIHLLENDLVSIKDVVFFGCTLWTDYELFGNASYAGLEASQRMTDYKKIRLSPSYSKFKSIHTTIIHRKSLCWLTKALEENKLSKTVIITHHAPSKKSIPAADEKDILSAAYASNLDGFVAKSGAKLWVHGHIHNQLDYKIASTRVICNPRGYPDEPNDCFDPELVIEI